ncbi:MAG TPA: ABC transporter substrate-binding protein [Candidatus Binatia bacterium]
MNIEPGNLMGQDMCLRTRTLLASLVLLTLAAPTAAQLRKLNIAYTATSPYQAVLIIAKEAGAFKKHGLEPQLILTPGGSLGFQAMMGGDVAMVMADGSAAVTSNLAGADVVIIASFLNTFPYSLISIPEVKTVDQLVGGKVAISRFGSATDVSVRMSLAKVGLNPDKDVTILQIGTQTTRFAALQSKQVQATIITPPFTLTARKQGYNTLIDMGQMNIPFELTALLTRRSYIKAQRETVLDVVTALSEAVHYYKREKEPVLKNPEPISSDHRSRSSRRNLSRDRAQNDAGEALPNAARHPDDYRRARAKKSESQNRAARRLRRHELCKKTRRRSIF